MVELLKEKVENGMNIEVVTSSFVTQKLLLDLGFNPIPIAYVSSLDIYFDGCDYIDKELNALKSGGGIHTREKLVASMAKQVVIAGDESKYVEQFDNKIPLVVELLPEAKSFVQDKIQRLFPGARYSLRISEKMEGPVFTSNGNLLLDIWFNVWPELSKINSDLKTITGIVETSLFYNIIHKAIISCRDGIKIYERKVRSSFRDADGLLINP
jgi:ribose 5-phosphate isomerase A